MFMRLLRLNSVFLLVFILSVSGRPGLHAGLTDYVNPFIGTTNYGATHP